MTESIACVRLLLSAGLLTALSPPASAASAPAAPRCTLDRATGTTIERAPFLRDGYGLTWNDAAQRFAYTQPNAAGYYRIYTMRADRSGRRDLTAQLPLPAAGHRGSPQWQPAGRYLLFVAQHAGWHGRRLFGVPDYAALPGFGQHDDLWLASADGGRGWRLLDGAANGGAGVLQPVFAPDGRHVAWSERRSNGTYVLKVAALLLQPVPHLAAIRTYAPGGASYYETGSFTTDGSRLVYASNQQTGSFWRSQIFRLDLTSGVSTRLTRGTFYNEHPIVVRTSSGDWVIYMSTRDVRRRPLHVMPGTDWWAMRLDGSGAKRLTTMNDGNAGGPEDMGAVQIAGRADVFPDGTGFYGDVQDNLAAQTGLVRRVHFVCR